MASIVKWTLVVLYVIASLVTITMIGQPRKPTTPGAAAVAVLINALMAVAVVIAWDTDQ